MIYEHLSIINFVEKNNIFEQNWKNYEKKSKRYYDKILEHTVDIHFESNVAKVLTWILKGSQEKLELQFIHIFFEIISPFCKICGWIVIQVFLGFL